MQAVTEQTRKCFDKHTLQGARNFRNFVRAVADEREAIGTEACLLVINSWFYGVTPSSTDADQAQLEIYVRTAAQNYVTAVFQATMPGARVIAHIRPGNLIVEVNPKAAEHLKPNSVDAAKP